MLARAENSSSQEHAHQPRLAAPFGVSIRRGRTEEKLQYADMRQEEREARHAERLLRHRNERATIPPGRRQNPEGAREVGSEAKLHLDLLWCGCGAPRTL